MTSPYVTTELSTIIGLKPSQMNNEKNKKIFDNLVKYYEGKCYKNFGIVKKIYGITHLSPGRLIAENPTGEAVYDVKFKCKLCNPIESKEIICELDRIIIDADQLLRLSSGKHILGIVIEIQEDGKFYINRQKRILMYIKKDGTEIEVSEKTFVKFLVTRKLMYDRGDKIQLMGFLTDIATDSEIESYYKDENDDREI